MIFFKSVILGFLFAVPIGPVGLLCIRRTLQRGFLTGALTGLGAGAADIVYSSIAAFGLRAISETLTKLQKPIHLVGGLVILWFAWRTFKTKKSAEITTPKRPVVGIFLPTFMLALTNPATIIAFTVVFANLGFTIGHTWLEAGLVVAGVFTGSMLWWSSLSGIVSLTRSETILANMSRINRVVAAMLFGFALWSLAEAVYS